MSKTKVVAGDETVRGKHTQACQCIDAVDVHSTTAADSLSATPSECQGRVDLILDADQGIQHHRPSLIQIQRISLHVWLRGRLVRVPTVDVKGLGLGVRSGCRVLCSIHCRHRPHLGTEDRPRGRKQSGGGAKSCHGRGVETDGGVNWLSRSRRPTLL